MTMSDNKFADRCFIREDGLRSIRPVRDFPALDVISDNSLTPALFTHDLPFQPDDNTLFCIRDSIPVFETADSNVVSGLLIYDIRPDNWTLIFCHTSKLNGYETFEGDDGQKYGLCDFYDLPLELILPRLSDYVQAIQAKCDQQLLTMDENHPTFQALVNTVAAMDECASHDFTFDIYVPPQVCDLTGERYFRPGHSYGMLFDNPMLDADYETSFEFCEFLYKAVKFELPDHELETAYDVLKRFAQKQAENTFPQTGPAEDHNIRQDSREGTTYERKRRPDWDRQLSFRR